MSQIFVTVREKCRFRSKKTQLKKIIISTEKPKLSRFLSTLQLHRTTRVTVTANVLIDANLTRCHHVTSGVAACCAAGDGERLERVQPPGERCGLAEGGSAGADEPQQSSPGP